MAVAFDAKMTAGNQTTLHAVSAATSVSTTGHAVGASATLVVVVVMWQGTATGISFTWAGQSMTAGPVLTATQTSAIFYRISPTTGGSQTLAGSWTGTNDCYLSWVSFTGTDTSTGINVADSVTTSNGTGPNATSLTVTSDVNGATVVIYANNGDAPTMTQTQIFSHAALNPGGGASYAMGGTSNVHQFTNTSGANRVMAGVHVLAGGSDVPLITVAESLGVGDQRSIPI